MSQTRDRKTKTKTKSKLKSKHLHFIWQPFALMDFHLFVFDNQKVEDWKIWQYAFNQSGHSKDDSHQYPGMTFYDISFQTYTCAVSLMKSEDGQIDMSTIVHECVHATQHYVNLLEMNSSNDNPTNGEFGPELCSALVMKIVQILRKHHIKIVDRYDDLGMSNVIRCKK